MTDIFGFDAYAPKEIADRVESVGVAKARLPLVSQIALGALAGGFIGLGAIYFTLVTSDASLSWSKTFKYVCLVIYAACNTNTGSLAWRTTLSVTLPSTQRLTPERPCVHMATSPSG